MIKHKFTSLLLVAGFLLSVVISHLPVVYTVFYHELTGANKAVDAVLDLKNLSADEKIILDGEWEFYWNRLLVTISEKNARPDFLIKVPDYWTKYEIDGEYLPVAGYASYRLVLKNFHVDYPVAISLPDFGSAYRVYLDGRLCAESGVVSDKPEDVFSTTKLNLHPVTLSKGNEHEVIIEVATRRFSGLYMAPVLQNYQKAVSLNFRRNNLRLILFGTALFPFIVLIGVYTLSFRKFRQSFWLPAMGLLVLLRIMLTTEFFGFWQDKLFFNISYESTNPVMFLVSFAFKYLLIYLVEELMYISFSKKEKLFLLVYYTVLYLAYLHIPNGFYNRYLTVLLPTCAFLIEIYAFIKVFKNRDKLDKHSLWIYFSSVLAVTGLIIDCYYINGNIYSNLSLVLLVMFTLYLIIISLVSAVRTAEIYRHYAVNASQLEQTKTQLEIQKEYYRSLYDQINEVRSIRHDVRHFIGVLEQLLREKRYAELERFLSKYEAMAATQPLPVYCENVIVNSIIGHFALKFKKSDIAFSCACSVPEEIFVSDIDLCIVLSNSLENALEACERMEGAGDRFVDVEIRYVNSQLLIKITMRLTTNLI